MYGQLCMVCFVISQVYGYNQCSMHWPGPFPFGRNSKLRDVLYAGSRAVETHFKTSNFLGFLFSSQNFYFFISKSVNLFQLIGVTIIS